LTKVHTCHVVAAVARRGRLCPYGEGKDGNASAY